MARTGVIPAGSMWDQQWELPSSTGRPLQRARPGAGIPNTVTPKLGSIPAATGLCGDTQLLPRPCSGNTGMWCSGSYGFGGFPPFQPKPPSSLRQPLGVPIPSTPRASSRRRAGAGTKLGAFHSCLRPFPWDQCWCQGLLCAGGCWFGPVVCPAAGLRFGGHLFGAAAAELTSASPRAGQSRSPCPGPSPSAGVWGLRQG